MESLIQEKEVQESLNPDGLFTHQDDYEDDHSGLTSQSTHLINQFTTNMHCNLPG